MLQICMMRQANHIISARTSPGSIIIISDQDGGEKLVNMVSEEDSKESMVGEHLIISSVNVKTMSSRSS